MSLQGNLSGFTLSEIFRMISFSSKTGNLVIARDSSQGRVHFRDGEVYFASTPDNRLPLGLRLVDASLITQEHLNDALAAQKDDPDKRLGEILVSRGLVARDALADFVREQIQDALFEIFEWDDGTYYFEPAADTDEDIGLALSVDEIVVEAERRRHEWDEIRKLLPSIDCRVRLSTNAVALSETIELDPQEWAAVCHVADGADLHTLRTLLHLTSLGLCRMIARMIQRGVLEVTALEAVSATAPSGVEEDDFEAEMERYRVQAGYDVIDAGHAEEEAGYPVEPIEALPTPAEEDEAPVAEPIETAEYVQPQVAVAAVEPVVEEEPSIEEPLAEPTSVTAIRKYIRDASSSQASSERRKDYPIEWLTYYGRLNHRRSKAPSEQQLNSSAYRNLVAKKS